MMRRNGILLAACVLAVLLVACGDEEVKVVTPTPVIQVAVTATPNSVDSGGTVGVEATVTASGAGPLSYQWTASAGTFAAPTADSTAWTAPDDANVYVISVIVTDGTNVAIASANVGVDAYVPTDSPFYRGSLYCSTCHDGGPGGSQYASWAASPHASALTTLQDIGEGANPYCVDCHTVGSYGLNADKTKNNGGYDETAVPRLAGVQCENCHGAGSEHPGASPATTVGITLDAAMCGGCHNGEHHPTYDEWQTSLHSVVVTDAASASCAKCHNGLYAPQYLDDPANFTNPSTTPPTMAPLTCAGCHDPHGNDNPGNLRNASVNDALLPNNIVVENAGAGRLCISCHNGRRTETNVNDMIVKGNAHFGPHHSNQGDMLQGVNAYNQVAPSFAFGTSRHIMVQDGCVNCHTHVHPTDPATGNSQFTGHNFEPQVQACEPCHGTIADFNDIPAKEDFDGDGTVAGVQSEVAGLLNLLEETIIATATKPGAVDSLTRDFEGELGDTTVTTQKQRKSAYNWTFVEFDGSHGVHNTTYTVQLLQQSVLALDPTALPAKAFVLTRPE